MAAKEECRTEAEIIKEVGGLLYPGRGSAALALNLSYLESTEGAIRIIPTGVKSERLEALKIDLSKVTQGEANTIYEFAEKVKCMDEMVMVLADLAEGKKRLVMPKDGSKYFESGRQRIKKKVGFKMSKRKTPGRMITLTYDPVRVTRERAWANCGSHLSGLIDNIKVWLQRKKGIKGIQYFWVVEEQPATGYPHFHLFIQDDSPDQKGGYIPQRLIKRWWKRGGVHIKFCSASILGYIQKYIGKVHGMSAMALSQMWRNKRRLYGFSRVYVVKKDRVLEKRYDLLGMFHPVKGFGINDSDGYFWVGGCPVGWLLGRPDQVENWGSEGHEVILKRLWPDEPDPVQLESVGVAG